MTTQQKIERKGYKVTRNMGYVNGVLSIVSVTASKDGRAYTERNVTALLKRIS